MKNGMKRILGIIVFLSLFAFSGKAVLTSYAASSGSCGENLAWTLSDDGTLTISGEGAMDRYMDSSEQPWGSQRDSIKKVVIEEGVTSVGSLAFLDSTELTRVEIPNSVERIGVHAFGSCSKLGSVTIPNSVEIIENNAFYECTSLESVTIPESVTDIGDFAFHGCTSLESVTVLAGSTIVIGGPNTFTDCDNLKHFYLIGRDRDWTRFTNYLPRGARPQYFASVSVRVNNSAYGNARFDYKNAPYDLSDAGNIQIIATAMPGNGYVFAGWERNGEIVSTDNPWGASYAEMRDYRDGEADSWNLELKAIFKNELIITAADQKYVYNGGPQGFDGTDAYTNYLPQVTVKGLKSGDSISALKLTGQGTYAGDVNAVIPSDVKVQDGNGQDVSANYSITYVNGQITVSRASLEISARNKTFPYCGKETGIGDTVYEDPAEIAEMVTVGKLQGSDYLYRIQVFGQAKETGLHKGVIEPSNAVIHDAADKDVTENYQISYFNADLTITDSPPSYDVEITPGANMTKTGDSGELSQTVSGAITPVAFTADSGYYFPEDYQAEPENGISVTRSSESRITVSGTPTDHVELLLPDAEQKEAPEPPVETFTVSFDANGGSGSMDPVTDVSGEYTLPRCLFTAPEGMAFDGWLAEGAEYGEGDTLSVEADITVAAQWKEVPPEPHVHELALTEAAEAACTESGNTAYYVCGTCGKWFEDKTALLEITDKSSVIIKALGHKWDEGTVTKEPTETEEGVRTYTCQRDSSHTRTEAIPAKDHEHSLEKVEAVSPTCEKAGNTAYYVCGGCGKWFEDKAGTKQITDKSSVILKALGHAWDKGVITKAATVTRDGVKTYTCLRDSSHTRTELIPKRERNNPNRDEPEFGVAPAEDAWLMDGAGWHYRENGVLVKNAWRKLGYNGENYWYLFDENGTMKTGWAEWNGERYYLSPVSDGWMGHMLTGWQEIDGKWYYFETAEGSTQGRMYRNEKTPDGRLTGADGALIEGA